MKLPWSPDPSNNRANKEGATLAIKFLNDSGPPGRDVNGRGNTGDGATCTPVSL